MFYIIHMTYCAPSCTMAVNNNCSFKAGIISIADAIFRFVNREGHHCSIEIIDIECVLLSFLSKNFVSTKWRIYKGILASPRLLRQGICAVAGSQRCQVRDFIPRSRDFSRQLGFFKIFILKRQSRDFFGIFEKGKFEV